MKRLSRHIIIALLTFGFGVVAHTTARFLFGCGALGECSGTWVKTPTDEAARSHGKPAEVEVDGSCHKLTKAWEAGTSTRPLSYESQMRCWGEVRISCWGAHEETARPATRIKAHRRARN